MKLKSIRSRLMIIMICVTTLPVLTVTMIAIHNTRNSVEKEVVNANQSRMNWAEQYLNELNEQVNTLFYTIQIDDEIMDSLGKIGNPNPGVQFETHNYISEKLNSILYANSRKVDRITLYNHNIKKAMSVSFAEREITTINLKEGNWSRMLDGPENLYFQESDLGISAYHTINRFEDRSFLGGISILVKDEIWDEINNILNSEKESRVLIINDQREILHGSLSGLKDDEFIDYFYNLDLGLKDLMFFKTQDSFIWTEMTDNNKLGLIKILPQYLVNRSAYPIIKAGVITGGVFTILALTLSIILSFKISQPVMKLAQTMNQTQIQHFEASSVESNDEFGMLERDFNSLMKSIKTLIEEKYHREIELKNAQLKALQAQINPHFLNNTLQFIGGMALSRNVPEIYQIIKVIGDLFRYSISSKGDMVSLSDELEHTQNYLFIQEQRFGERCQVEIDYAENLLDNEIPRFSLQPIVENAFEYGLQPKKGIWELKIVVKRVSQKIIIMVKDNGIGFDRGKLIEVRQSLNDNSWLSIDKRELVKPRKGNGIGLRNVNNRFRLHFGNKYGIRIFSKKNIGTLIVMTMPAKEDWI